MTEAVGIPPCEACAKFHGKGEKAYGLSWNGEHHALLAAKDAEIAALREDVWHLVVWHSDTKHDTECPVWVRSLAIAKEESRRSRERSRPLAAHPPKEKKP